MKPGIANFLRWCGSPLAVVALCGAAIAVAHAESLVERTNRGLVEMVTGGGDGAAIQMAEDMANVLDDGATRRVLPVVGHGAVQNLIDLRALRGVDIGIVQTDVMEYVRKN